MRSYISVLLALFSLVFAASPASAHVTSDLGVGFGAGFLHPWTGADHLLAMVSVGIWGAELGAPAIWLLPIAFPLIMAVGGALGALGVPLPGTELLIALSVTILGAMVALAQRLPLALALTIVGVFAIAHGHAHGAELPKSADAVAFTVGFVLATGLLHATGIVIGVATCRPAGAVLVRAGGVLIGLAGCVFIYQYAGQYAG